MFIYSSRAAMARALKSDAEAIQIAIYDGQQPLKAVGTSSDIAHWAKLGGETCIIHISPSLRIEQLT